MSTKIRPLIIEVPPGYKSNGAGLFVEQLNNLSERMERDIEGLSPDDFIWQPSLGVNSIGMLLVHIAIVEVYWCKRMLEQVAEPEQHVEDVLGIKMDFDGIPLSANGQPPQYLGRDAAYFLGLFQRARAHTDEVVRTLSDEDMEHEFEMHIPTGELRIMSRRWTLYHILEHQAGHYGQILLLKHLMGK
jgi:uncharacterized damage-inducible protein DinB